jgi:hypothetical protein
VTTCAVRERENRGAEDGGRRGTNEYKKCVVGGRRSNCTGGCTFVGLMPLIDRGKRRKSSDFCLIQFLQLDAAQKTETRSLSTLSTSESMTASWDASCSALDFGTRQGSR